eukprot:COSAG02_NODE_816_length_16859_cov_15.645764_10_plen_398_part_00
MDVLSRVGRELQGRAAHGNARGPTLTETLRNDPISRATMIAGRALSTADRANGGLAQAISLRSGPVADPPPMEEAVATAAAMPPQPPQPQLQPQPHPPQSLSDVLPSPRVGGVQFNQALEAQLQRSRQLLAAAAALGQGTRPLPAADTLEPAVPQPPTEVALPPRPYVDHPPTQLALPARHDAVTRTEAAGARSQSQSQTWREPEPEPELKPETQLHTSTTSPLGARRSPLRTVSGFSDWRAEFLRTCPFFHATLATVFACTFAQQELSFANRTGSTLSTEILPGTWSSSASVSTAAFPAGDVEEAADLDRRGSVVSAQQGSDVDSIGGPPRTLSALESYRAWERSIGLEDHRQSAEQERQSQGSSKKSRRKKPPRESCAPVAFAIWLHFSVFSVMC